jgi:hypothetical protein
VKRGRVVGAEGGGDATLGPMAGGGPRAALGQDQDPGPLASRAESGVQPGHPTAEHHHVVTRGV